MAVIIECQESTSSNSASMEMNFVDLFLGIHWYVFDNCWLKWKLLMKDLNLEGQSVVVCFSGLVDILESVRFVNNTQAGQICKI